jgi:hypothetical protein
MLRKLIRTSRSIELLKLEMPITAGGLKEKDVNFKFSFVLLENDKL